MTSGQSQPRATTQPGDRSVQADKERRPSGHRKDVIGFVAIVLVALALRVVYTFQVCSSPYFDAPIMDAQYHDEWARAIVAGEPYVEGSYFRAPLYPWFLAGTYAVSGGSYLFPRIVQGVLGSLTCGLLFLVGRDAFGRKVGVIAGVAAASYWILLYYDAELLIPVLITFLDTLLVWRLLRAHRRPSAMGWLLCGLILGVSAIARPNIVLFGPALVAWRLVVEWRKWKRFAVQAACLFAGCMVPIVPVTMRNYCADGDLVLISSQGGLNFYIGNHVGSDGASVRTPDLPADWWGLLRGSVERAEEAEGHSLKPSEVSRYWFGQGVRFWQERPGEAVRLTLSKAATFWGAREVANFKDIDFLTERFAPVVRFLPLGFWLIGPFGLVGLVLALGRGRELFPLWGFVVVYMASVVMFFVTARFRVPVLPILIVLATYSVFWFAGAVRARRWTAVGGAAVVLIAAGLLTNMIGHTPKQSYAYPYVDLAGALLRKDRADQAIDYLNEATRVEPDNADVYYTLGLAWTDKGDAARAESFYRKAVALEPSHAEAHNNLGKLLGDAGETQAAIGHYRQAIEAKPDHAGAHFNLARALRRTGDIEGAVRHFRAGLRAQPDRVDALVDMSKLLAKVGRAREATDALGQAVSIEPKNVELLIGLAKILAGYPDPAVRDGREAAVLAERACELTGWRDLKMILVLADAYAEAGQFDRALDALDKVQSAGEGGRDPELDAQIQLRRGRFANGKTVYEP